MSSIQEKSVDASINEQLVSVGIPTYNRPEGLRRTLESITGQTYKNLEIIISDNFSPELETEAVVREYMERDSRIQYYRQQKNTGAWFNFQFVLEQATGEFFLWAADDDEWSHQFIELLVEQHIKYPSSALAMSAIMRSYGDLREPWDVLTFPDCNSHYQNYFYLARVIAMGEKYNIFIYGIFRTSLLKKVRPPMHVIASDRLFILDVVLSFPIRYIDNILYYRRLYTVGPEIRNPSDLGKIYQNNIKTNIQYLLAVLECIIFSRTIPDSRKIMAPFIFLFFLYSQRFDIRLLCWSHRLILKFLRIKK